MQISTTLALILAATPAQAADPVTAILDRAAAACTGLENGTFDPGEAVQPVDLTGDGQHNILIDEGKFSCTSAASMYCGSGGCQLHAIVDNQVTTWQATGWRTLTWGPATILLIGRDGGWCGGAGSEVCFEALNWSGDRFLTVMPDRN